MLAAPVGVIRDFRARNSCSLGMSAGVVNLKLCRCGTGAH